MLDQSTLQAHLRNNPILVSVDELQKFIVDITRDERNTQEPPFVIPTTTSGQPQEQASKDTSPKVDSIVKVVMIEQKTQTTKKQESINDQTRQTYAFEPSAQIQVAQQITIIVQGRPEEQKDIP